MSAQREEQYDDAALIELVRDELARRATTDLYDAFQEYDELHSSPEDGNASPYEWAKHLEATDDDLWADALYWARASAANAIRQDYWEEG